MSRNLTTQENRFRSQKGVSELAEFGPTLYVLFVICLVPLVDIATIMTGAATQYLETNDLAAKAATESDFIASLTTMHNEANNFPKTGLAKLANLSPVGGYISCGSDLNILTTDMGTGATTASPANTPLTAQINTKQQIYEMQVSSSCSVSPLISLSQVPFLQNVPGLSQPVIFNFKATRPVEHPGGLESAQPNAENSVVSPFVRVNTVTPVPNAPPVPNVNWRNPNIFQQIAASGKTVVSINVLTVYADVPNWLSTGLTINPGDTIWVDTSALGEWSGGPSNAPTDANGCANQADIASGVVSQQNRPEFIAPNCEWGCLAGKVSNGTPFFVGDTEINLPLTQPGLFSLVYNDTVGAFTDNTGAQMVRIIVTH